jgi:hypothetical protein
LVLVGYQDCLKTLQLLKTAGKSTGINQHLGAPLFDQKARMAKLRDTHSQTLRLRLHIIA